MKAERLFLLLTVLLWVTYSDNNHTEPDDTSGKPVTIYELFPGYNLYDNLYHVASCIAMENITTGLIKEFLAEEAGLLIKVAEPDWKIPQNAPYVLDFGSSMGLHLYKISEICRVLSN